MRGTTSTGGVRGAARRIAGQALAVPRPDAGLVTFVDMQDANGDAVRQLGRGADKDGLDVLSAVSVNNVLRALQAVHPGDDALVTSRMSEIFSGMLESGRSRRRAETEADNAELFGDGRVAIVRDKKEVATNGILFERGVQIVVYVDGDNIGVVRERSLTLRMDDPALVAVIHAAGEEMGDGDGAWFAHSAGFLLAWGARKAPAAWASHVDPRDLAMAAARLLAAASNEH